MDGNPPGKPSRTDPDIRYGDEGTYQRQSDGQWILAVAFDKGRTGSSGHRRPAQRGLKRPSVG